MLDVSAADGLRRPIDEGVAEGRHIDQVDGREDGRHGARHCVDQPVVRWRPARVHDRHPARLQVVLRLLEELAGRQVEGDVRLPVGVHHDHVVAVVVGRQPVAAVLHHRVDTALAEVEVAIAGGEDVGVDLDADLVDAVAIRQVELAGRGAAGEPDDGDVRRHRLLVLRGPEVVRQEHVVPGPAGGRLGRVVDRVDSLTLVEDQLRPAAVLHDLDVAVRRLLLVEQPSGLGRLDADRLDEDAPRQDQDPEQREDPPARPEPGHREQEQGEAEADQRRPRAVAGNEPEDGQEGAEDAAGRAQCVDRAGRVPACPHVAEQEPDGEGRDAAEQDDGDREEGEDRQQAAQDQAGAEGREALLALEKDRVGDERDQPDPERGHRRHLEEHLVARVAVGEPAADDVADAEVDQDQPDQHAPDVEAGPEVRRQQPGGAELDAQRGHAGDEDKWQEQPARHWATRLAVDPRWVG